MFRRKKQYYCSPELLVVSILSIEAGVFRLWDAEKLPVRDLVSILSIEAGVFRPREGFNEVLVEMGVSILSIEAGSKG